MPKRLEAYANAAEVLPRGLLRQVQRRFEGGLLWIPPRKRRRLKTAGLSRRDAAIRRARAQGASMASLARRFRLSAEWVRQIVRKPSKGQS